MTNKEPKDKIEYKIGDEEYNNLRDYIQCGLLKHCVCGISMESLLFLQRVLNHIDQDTKIMMSGSSWTREYIEESTKKFDALFYNDDGIKYTILYMLDKYGLTEHGGSVSACWIDTDGEKLLEHLNKLFRDNSGER